MLRCAEGGRPFPSKVIPQWHGDSRGRWEEDTWGNETTGYAPEGAFRGVSAGIRVVEWLTRVGPETVEFEIATDDPAARESPWTLMFSMKKTEQPMFEYACHEGDHGLANILRNARLEELGKIETTP